VKNRISQGTLLDGDYPIFMRECRTEDGKIFYKIYEPLNYDKGQRFSYAPAGIKPRRYINGLAELQKAYGEREAKAAEDDDNKVEDAKLPEAIICSGERDSLCCKMLGYFPLWFNSETYELSEEEYNSIMRYVWNLYNVPDLDSTGMERGRKLAMRFRDIRTIILPADLQRWHDNRGKPRKDLRDWFELRHSNREFEALINNARPSKFWEYSADKNGKAQWRINSVYLDWFLSLLGFFTLKDDNSNTARYIYKTGNVVREVRARDIKKYLIAWCDDVHNNVPMGVQQLARDTRKLSDSSLETLPELDLDFRNYTENTQLFFINNQVLEVNKQGIEEHESGDGAVKNCVWEDNVLRHRFSRMDDMFKVTAGTQPDGSDWDIVVRDSTSSCLFGYIINSSRLYWRKELEEYVGTLPPEEQKTYREQHKFDIAGPALSDWEIAEQKQCLINKLFAIGYMMHRYKGPSRAWAPMAMDYKIGEDGECNGRSGKSFLFRTLAMLMKSVKLSGRNKRLMDNPHVFDQVTKATDLILVDDCNQSFDFNTFYDLITADLTVNPKNNQSYTIPFAESPKFAFTTNYVPNKFDASTEARLLYIVYSDYYHQNTEELEYKETRSIRDDFGRDLFTEDYPEANWNADINFLLQCCAFYMSQCEAGVKPQPPMANIYTRKLKQTMGPIFEDWAVVYFSQSGGHVNTEVVRTEAYDDFKEVTKDKFISAQSWMRRLQAFCEYNHFVLNPEERCNDGRRIVRWNVKNDGKTYEMIYVGSGDAEPKPTDAHEEQQELPF